MNKQIKLEFTNEDAFQAVKENDVNRLRTLLEGGVRVDTLDEHNITLFVQAAHHGFLDIMKLLVEFRDMDFLDFENAMITASSRNRIHIVRFMFDHRKQDRSQLIYSNVAHPHEMFLYLKCAAEYGSTDVLTFLLENGAKANQSDVLFRSALSIASEYGQLSAVKILVEKGADVNHMDGKEETPLFKAIQRNNTNTAAFLIKNGACVNTLCNGRLTCLMEAAHTGNVIIAGLLIDNGALLDLRANLRANLSSTKEESHSALSIAFKYYHHTSADYLAMRGAEITKQDRDMILQSKSSMGIQICLMHLPINQKSIVADYIENHKNFKEYVCKVPIRKVTSLLIGRELCPDSPFYRHRFPLDLLKFIFDMCGFIPIKKIIYPCC
jgi:ankyrin repeat protein